MDKERISVRVRPFFVPHDDVERHGETLYAIELICPEMAAISTIVAIHNPRFTPVSDIKEQAALAYQRAETYLKILDSQNMTIDKSKLN